MNKPCLQATQHQGSMTTHDHKVFCTHNPPSPRERNIPWVAEEGIQRPSMRHNRADA